MSTFKDLLVWYNDLDAVPFLEVVQKMSQFWQARRLTCLKMVFLFLPHLKAFICVPVAANVLQSL